MEEGETKKIFINAQVPFQRSYQNSSYYISTKNTHRVQQHSIHRLAHFFSVVFSFRCCNSLFVFVRAHGGNIHEKPRLFTCIFFRLFSSTLFLLFPRAYFFLHTHFLCTFVINFIAFLPFFLFSCALCRILFGFATISRVNVLRNAVTFTF